MYTGRASCLRKEIKSLHVSECHRCACAQRVILGLILVSVAAAAYSSRAEHAYSDAYPKRIMLQHLHLLGPNGTVQASAASLFGALSS